MSRPIAIAFFAFVLFAAVAMSSQEPAGKYPLMEGIAQKLIQKYQTSSCEQLQAEKQQPPDPKQAQMKAKAFEQLHKDPEMRKAFLDKVAAPIVNKMFECGMIP